MVLGVAEIVPAVEDVVGFGAGHFGVEREFGPGMRAGVVVAKSENL